MHDMAFSIFLNGTLASDGDTSYDVAASSLLRIVPVTMIWFSSIETYQTKDTEASSDDINIIATVVGVHMHMFSGKLRDIDSLRMAEVVVNSFPGKWVLAGSKKARESSCVRYADRRN